MPKAFDAAKTRVFIVLLSSGMSQRSVAKLMGTDSGTVFRIAKHFPFPARRTCERWLSIEEKEEILCGIQRGESKRSIARRLGRAPSTITREIANQGPEERYRPRLSERRAERTCRRPKPRKLESNVAVASAVEHYLAEDYSPQQIAARLKEEYPDTPAMQVSHETIYKSLYLQGRGALRKELTRHLRTARTQRQPHGNGSQKRGVIPNMVNISERPAEVEDRAVPGHWEGDLIMGKERKSCIGTLVERSTRFVMLLHLPGGAPRAQQVREALTKKILQLPEELRRSLTWDQGKELSQHARFTVDTGVDVYFCDPHSPWQRGSNENTNGLLRQYFPKGTDLSGFTEAELDAVAAKMNRRPRQTLGWKTPSFKLNELLR